MLTNEQPQVQPTSRYTIGQTTRLLGISRNTLRKYTRNGDIKSLTHKSGKALYTGVAILAFWRAVI